MWHGNQQATLTPVKGEMHTKDTGKIGELTVILQLKQAGYIVFTEVGDNCPIDLIVLKNNQCWRGQVKSCKAIQGKAELSLRKAGPNGYLRKYKDDEEQPDFFALFVRDTGQIAYISAKEAYRNCPASAKLTFRIEPPKNGQKKGVHYLKDYANFEGVLRD